ncbi:MAG: DoxX family protein [Sediminibacterium sp.]|nr:DoxX family protein [Sediminibacterium sp.]
MLFIKTLYWKTITALVVSICLGIVFIFSGWTKLDPVIETFEFTFVDIGLGNWYTAPVLARLMIGLEFFTGFLLIVGFRLRQFTLPLMGSILIFFCIYLTVQIIVSGNSGNCGCFGETYKMSPGMAIAKNSVMLLAGGVIYWLCKGWSGKYDKLFLSFTGLTALLLPFILNPLDYSYTSNNLNEAVNYKLELNLLYEPTDSSKVEIPNVDVRKGKQVVTFLSLSCPHCRIAAKKFHLIKKNNPDLPVYFILNGDKTDYKLFVEDTKADNIPHSFCLGETFVKLAGVKLPRIYYLEDGTVIKKVDYYELNQYDIEDWMKK